MLLVYLSVSPDFPCATLFTSFVEIGVARAFTGDLVAVLVARGLGVLSVLKQAVAARPKLLTLPAMILKKDRRDVFFEFNFPHFEWLLCILFCIRLCFFIRRLSCPKSLLMHKLKKKSLDF